MAFSELNLGDRSTEMARGLPGTYQVVPRDLRQVEIPRFPSLLLPEYLALFEYEGGER